MSVRLVGFYKAKCVKHLIIRILIGKHQSAALGPRHRLQLYKLWLETDRRTDRQMDGWRDRHTRASANVASNKLRRASNVAGQHDSNSAALATATRIWMRWEPRGLLLMRRQPEWRLSANDDDNVQRTSWRRGGVAARHGLSWCCRNSKLNGLNYFSSNLASVQFVAHSLSQFHYYKYYYYYYYCHSKFTVCWDSDSERKAERERERGERAAAIILSDCDCSVRLFVIEIAWLYSLISPFTLCARAFALALPFARNIGIANSKAHTHTHTHVHARMTHKHISSKKSLQAFASQRTTTTTTKRTTRTRVSLSVMLCACSKCEQAAQCLPSPCASKQVCASISVYVCVCAVCLPVCVSMYLGQLSMHCAQVFATVFTCCAPAMGCTKKSPFVNKTRIWRVHNETLAIHYLQFQLKIINVL